MVIVCKADGVGCVPAYAVACEVTWAGDSTQAGRPGIPVLTEDEQTWCAAQPRIE
jgi:hypothetical protein